MAMRDSVTVSIAEDDSGIAKLMRREKRAEVSASEGITSLLLGRSKTSSNVSPVNANGSLAAGVVTVFMVPAQQVVLANDSPSIRNSHRVSAIPRAQFAENTRRMGFDRVIRQAQVLTNFAV